MGYNTSVQEKDLALSHIVDPTEFHKEAIYVNTIKFSRFFHLDYQLVLRKIDEFVSLGDFELVSKVYSEQVSDDLLIQTLPKSRELGSFKWI